MLSRPRTDIIFILIGVIPIIVAYFLHPEGLGHELLKDFGVVIVSLTVVDLLWQLVGGEPLSKEIEEMRNLNTLTRQAHESGLEEVGSKRTKLTDAWNLHSISQCRQAIDMCGHTLFTLIENQSFLHALIEQAKRNVKVRLLIYAPDNPALQTNINPAALETSTGQMRNSWATFNAERNKLSKEHKANFEVRRLHSRAMHASIVRIDDRLTALGYLNSKYTAESPIYAIKGSDKPLFRIYAEEFDFCFGLGDTL